MEKEFNARLEKLEGKMEWTVFYVPFSVEEVYGTKGRFNVSATIDGHSFSGTLLPSRNGHYMVYNREIKAACNKKLGDSLHVVLKPDTAERILEIPDDILAVLKGNPSAYIRFQELPYYIKREEIKKITDAKQDETRLRRLEAFVQKLNVVKKE